MQRLLILLALPVLFLFACDKEEFMVEEHPVTVAKKKEDKPFVPISGSMVATSVFGVDYPVAENVPKCGQGFPVINFQSNSEGKVTHLGKATSYTSSCVNTATNPPAIYNVELTFTAANGDQLHLVSNESSNTATRVFDIAGGSGRFEDAEGYLNGSFERPDPDGPIVTVFEGMIRY